MKITLVKLPGKHEVGTLETANDTEYQLVFEMEDGIKKVYRVLRQYQLAAMSRMSDDELDALLGLK